MDWTLACKRCHHRGHFQLFWQQVGGEVFPMRGRDRWKRGGVTEGVCEGGLRYPRDKYTDQYMMPESPTGEPIDDHL